jgi:hypothetical protein
VPREHEVKRSLRLISSPSFIAVEQVIQSIFALELERQKIIDVMNRFAIS